MILCAAGDIHGALDRLFSDIAEFEGVLGTTFDAIVHVGDFGIWPDPKRIDRATRRHDGAGDFPAWHAEQRAVPRPTVFVKGNHEDFVWLDAHPTGEVLPGLRYLRNGEVAQISSGGEILRVGGLGGCFGPSDFERPSSSLQGGAKRHYTRDEITSLSRQADLDILLIHDAPAGVRFARHRRGEGYVSEAAGLDELIAATHPRVCFFGHHHTRVDAEICGVRCIGLNKSPHAGSLVALEMHPGESEWQLLGEWQGSGSDPGAFASIEPLARRMVELTAQAHALGMFTGDRELLRCPACGLMEDVLSDGVLVTYHEGSDREDTGLRFAEVPRAEGRFVCPECGSEVEACVT